MAADEQGPPVPQLSALTAEFDKTQHTTYVELVEQAFKLSTVRNIALTGNYGTGKSSILAEVSRRYGKRALSISLSTLGGESPTNTTPTKTEGASDDLSLSSRVQREIVKQLLFRERPERVRRSNYRRVGKFKWLREGLGTASVTLAILFLLWVTGLLPHVLITPFNSPVGPLPIAAANWVVYAITFLLVTAMLTLGKWVLNPRIALTQVGAAGASVSLGKTDSTFDKNLEEIIYFFEVTDVDIVIFEDIDRFDTASIFEPLRELNTLLNGSLQIRRNVRFIYAIKDSIFEQLGEVMTSEENTARDAGDAELNRANRTKFFDWVVPVVPFITELNARDLMATLFEQVQTKWKPNPGLLDLVAEHLTDMRLMKNIVNEYQVFASRLLDTVPDITPDRLLAMIVYKNIHLGDFERITRGNSDLHTVYRASRVVKAAALERLQEQLATTKRKIEDGGSQDARAQQLGDALHTYLDRVARHVKAEYELSTVTAEGQTFPPPELRTPAFWAAVASSESLQVMIHWPNYGASQSLTTTVADLRRALRDPLTPARWAAQDGQRLERYEAQLTRRLEEVRRADFQHLVIDKAAHATVEQLTKQDALPPVNELVSRDTSEVTFAEVVDQALQSRLARKLVTAGHIDQYFALFVTQYYGTRVPTEARLFLMQHVDPGTPDTYFTFERADSIEAVLESRADLLDEPTSNNIEIVDYVAAAGGARLTRLAARLASLGTAERAFMDAYLKAGKHRGALVQAMSADTSELPGYILDHPDVDERLRVALLSSVLAGAAEGTEYQANPALADFIRDHYANMPTLAGTKAAGPANSGTVELLRQVDVNLPDIRPLRAELQAAVMDYGLYDFTLDNLTVGVKDGNLALDHIKDTSAPVYQNVLGNLPTYVGFREVQTTIEAAPKFSDILNDLPVATTSMDLYSLITRATPEASVTSLEDVPTGTWPALIRAHRAPLTFDNVQRYVSEHGIDASLGEVLAAGGGIAESADAEESDRMLLAVKIVDAHESLPDVAQRVRLVDSLKLTKYLDPDDLTPADGALLGGLLEGGVIEDAENAFLRFAASGWAAIEGGLRASKAVATFISPSIIDENRLPALLASSKVPEPIKTTIVNQLPTYAPSRDVVTVNAAARLAAERDLALTADLLVFLAAGGATKPDLCGLLLIALDDLNDTDLLSVLGAMPQPYPSLIATGKKKVSVPNDDLHRRLHQRLQPMGFTQRFNPGRLDPTEATVTHP